MILLHGTYKRFDKFNRSFLGQNTKDNAADQYLLQTAYLGFWFSDNCGSLSEIYDIIMDCEVTINNPYVIDSLETLASYFELTDKAANELVNELIDCGYDGIMIEYDEEFEGTSYIAFNEDQINIIS